jgi:hypothetical protein
MVKGHGSLLSKIIQWSYLFLDGSDSVLWWMDLNRAIPEAGGPLGSYYRSLGIRWLWHLPSSIGHK